MEDVKNEKLFELAQMFQNIANIASEFFSFSPQCMKRVGERHTVAKSVFDSFCRLAKGMQGIYKIPRSKK